MTLLTIILCVLMGVAFIYCFYLIRKKQEQLYEKKLQLQKKQTALYYGYTQMLVQIRADITKEGKKRDQLQEEIKQEEATLQNLVETQKAAKAALLKEKEEKDKIDNYRLIPSDTELIDAKKLNEIKEQLKKPRILSMLIWQTYWQPLAKVKFPVILQDKTKTGIYKITNIKTQECYIGQSVDIYKRWCEHCKAGLGIDTPPGNKLYKAIQSEGLENFTFELLTECEASALNEREKYFIALYQADTYGYNSNIGVNTK